jgi:LacI family transcriptional regulator
MVAGAEGVSGTASGRTVTIKDVARHAGLSKSTVARALAGAAGVSPDARDRARRAAAELNYRANGLARSMITRQTESVGVVVPQVSPSFFSNALGGITEVARKAGYVVLLVSSESDVALERAAVEALLTKHVDALLVAPVQPDDVEHLRRAEDAGVPVTLLDRPGPGLRNASTIALDNVKASTAAVEHLVGLGHRDIGLVTLAPVPPGRPGWSYQGIGTTFPSWDRLEGYKRALAAAGIPYRPEYVARGTYYSRRSAYVATRELLERNPGLTALYCTDNETSLGAFGAVQDLGIACPQDLSFVGFDDLEWATVVRPKVTVVEQPAFDLGRLAAEEVLDILGDPDHTRSRLTLEATLVVRDSTAPPARRS